MSDTAREREGARTLPPNAAWLQSNSFSGFAGTCS